MGGRLAEPANREGREVGKHEISRPSWDKGRPLRSVTSILLLVSLTILLVFFVAGCGGAQEGASGSAASGETSSGERSTSGASNAEVTDSAPATAAPVTTVAPDAGAPEVTGSQGGEGESTSSQIAQGEQRGQGGGSAQGTQDAPVAGEALTVTFLDVGQGNSALIQLPGEGKKENVLVDGGPTEAGPLLVQRLGELGVRELDAMVLSHADEDHVGGLIDVMETVPVETVYDSGYPHSTQVYDEFLAAVEESGARYVETRAGDEVREVSPAELDFIYPDGLGEGTNESSLILDLTYGDFDALFTGDAGIEQEEDLLAAGRVPDVELLQVGHHGSSDATSAKFLRVSSPEAAVIQVGADNSYGHPTGEVLARLGEYGAKVYRTDPRGEISFTSDGSGYQASSTSTGTGAASEPSAPRTEQLPDTTQTQEFAPTP
jgi:beta-lactamase superfamily II metal-dependent hydrolase